MTEYEGTAIYDASNGYNCEADSLEEAIEKLEAQVGAPSLCHQCSSEVSLGDIVGLIVYRDGVEVADTRYEAKQLAKAVARVAELEQKLAALAPAAVVMPERCGEVDYPGNYGPYGTPYNAALDDVARLNRRAIPADLLDRISAYLVRKGSEGFKLHEELRALLGKEGGK